MTGRDFLARWHQVEAWLCYAEDDARIGRGCRGFEPAALGGGAYHCQQAAETLLKAFLVQARIAFRKTTWIRWRNRSCRMSRGFGHCWQP
jgi:HEPN domain-containing protein